MKASFVSTYFYNVSTTNLTVSVRTCTGTDEVLSWGRLSKIHVGAALLWQSLAEVSCTFTPPLLTPHGEQTTSLSCTEQGPGNVLLMAFAKEVFRLSLLPTSSPLGTSLLHNVGSPLGQDRQGKTLSPALLPHAAFSSLASVGSSR